MIVPNRTDPRPISNDERAPQIDATQHVGAGVVGAEDVSRTEHARGRVQVVADKRVLDRQDRCQQRDQADEHEPADRQPREHAEAPLLEPLVAVRRDGHLDHATAAGEDLGFSDSSTTNPRIQYAVEAVDREVDHDVDDRDDGDDSPGARCTGAG